MGKGQSQMDLSEKRTPQLQYHNKDYHPHRYRSHLLSRWGHQKKVLFNGPKYSDRVMLEKISQSKTDHLGLTKMAWQFCTGEDSSSDTPLPECLELYNMYSNKIINISWKTWKLHTVLHTVCGNLFWSPQIWRNWLWQNGLFLTKITALEDSDESCKFPTELWFSLSLSTHIPISRRGKY